MLFTGSYAQCSRGCKKFLKGIFTHFNCSFMQLKQQASGHNNISLVGIYMTNTYLKELVHRQRPNITYQFTYKQMVFWALGHSQMH